MNKNRIECIACLKSFRSERTYSSHECTPVNHSPCLKEEPMEDNEDFDSANIVVKIEPSDLLEIQDDIDPLSFSSVKEEIMSSDQPVMDIKTENDADSPIVGEIDRNEDEALTDIAATFITNKSNLQCNSCNKTFQSNKTFNKHVISAHKTFKPYSCHICDKKFLQKHYVTLHMRVHTGERPYACYLCPKKYTHKTSYTIHMRIHKGERPYECGVCGKKCYDKSGLTSHIRSHTKETPYKCDLCDRRFTHSKSLLVHKRNHTGERPYICRYCGKAFRHWHKHKIHVRLHTGERPYKCKVCGKGFPRNDEVKRHMRSHTGIKSFRCSICDAYCATQSSITGHINLHHSNLKNSTDPPEKTQVVDSVSGILGNEAPESRNIYKNIAQQSNYVAKILMSAQNIRDKINSPSTKVIEITTKEPSTPLRPQLRNFHNLAFTPPIDGSVSKLTNSEKSLNYKEFLVWREKMLHKHSLVVKDLPSDEDKTSKNSVKSTPIQTTHQGHRVVATKQQYLLLQPRPSSAVSKLLLPINNVGTHINSKTPIDVPSKPVRRAIAPSKPYLIVPESVAAQPMFLLSSGSQKMLFLGSPETGSGGRGLSSNLLKESSSQEIKEENESLSSPSENMSPISIKMEPVD